MSNVLYASPAPDRSLPAWLPAALTRHRRHYTARFGAGERIDLLPAAHTDLLLVERGQVHLCCATRRLIRARYTPGDVINPCLQGDQAAELIAHTAARIIRVPLLLLYNLPHAERPEWPPVMAAHVSACSERFMRAAPAAGEPAATRTADRPHRVWGVVALNLCGYLFAAGLWLRALPAWPDGALVAAGLGVCFGLANWPLLRRIRRA
ncbi:MAG: hypothetical protein AAF730_09210 [Bacteroidota bacterium]